MLHTEHAFLDRLRAAADAVFEAVEFLLSCEFAPATLAAQLRAQGPRQALFNAASKLVG